MLKKLLLIAALGACPELFGQFDQTEFLHLDHVNYHNNDDSRMIADMNNDGLEDVVQGNVVLTIRYGNGSGLNEPILLPNSSSELNIAASFSNVFALLDIDNNGLLDIILINRCLLNFGYNNFSASQILAEGNIQFVKDYNNDGFLDIMFREYGNTMDTHTLLFNDGAGNFSASSVIIPLGMIVVSVDFNADGYTDIAYYNGIYFNDGNGNFPIANTVISSMNWYDHMYATGDSDADGYPEIAYTNFQNTLYIVEYDPNGWIINVHTDLEMPTGPELFFSDMNTDGIEDIVAKNSDYGPLLVKIFFGNGDGTFYNSNSTFGTVEDLGNYYGDFFDLDNDSELDFLQVSQDSIVVFRNNIGYFESMGAVPNLITRYFSFPMILDLNEDGLMDIVARDSANHEIYLMNQGWMVFSAPILAQLIPMNYLDFKVLNFTNNNFPDILFLTENQLFLMQNSGGNYFFNPVQITVSNDLKSFEVSDFDCDSDFDIFYSKMDGSLWLQENIGNNIFAAETMLLDAVLGAEVGFEVIVHFAVANLADDIYPEIFLARNFLLDYMPNQLTQTEYYYFGNETGTIGIGLPILGTPVLQVNFNTFTNLIVGDFNHDGFNDVTQDFNGFKFFPGDGQGNFSQLSFPGGVGTGNHLSASNIDNDENVEFILGWYGNISMPIGEIDSQNNLIVESIGPGILISSRFIDANNDGHDDIILSGPPNGDLTLFINDTDGNFLNYGAYVLNGSYMYDEISQVDIDNDTDRDMVWINTVGVMLARSNGEAISSIQISVYADENENGINDNEPILSGVPVSIQPPQQTYYTNANGAAAVAKSEGEYFVNCLSPSLSWNLSDYASDTILVTNQSQIFEIEFGLKPNGVVGGIQSSFQHFNSLCTDSIYSSLGLFNEGNVRGNIFVTMNIDTNCTFVSAIPAPTSVANSTVFWQIDSIGHQANVPIAMTFIYPGIDSLGLILHHQIFIDEYFQSQLVFSDSLDIEEVITCAYDPNDITEHNGYTEAGYILDGDQLEYTIRFQNTGNAPASNVRIENQLSSLLQRSTLQPIVWSHNFELMIDENAKAIFTFDNINLPDSVNNELESHGFVTYRILPVTGLAPQTLINNSAEIFFDFNPPILTNTAVNTVYDCADLQQSIVSDDQICEGDELSCSNNAVWIESLTWTFINTPAGTGNITFSPSENGALYMHASNQLCDLMEEFMITVNVAAASFTSNGNMLSAIDATSYQWYLNGDVIENAMEQVFLITETGSYSVLTTDATGCAAISEAQLITYSGMRENAQEKFILFPNPTSDNVRLTIPESLVGENLIVTNAMGQKIGNPIQMKSTSYVFDCTALPIGIYQLRIGNWVGKLVVE